ncbi:MAG: chorismate mutase [Spirochaetaceae bacterium]
MPVYAVRGAIQLQHDTAAAMEQGVSRLFESLLTANDVHEDRIVSVVFSQTQDLCAENPARALRRTGAAAGTALFCTQEPTYPDSLPRVVRILLTFESPRGGAVHPVYLEGARRLRPDLSGDGQSGASQGRSATPGGRPPDAAEPS